MRKHLLKGAEREAAVVMDLLGRGFEVFPAFGTGMSCDMVAQKFGKLLRVEVKGQQTGRSFKASGPVGTIGTIGGSKTTDCHLFEIKATVMPNGEIYYQRSILHKPNAASLALPLREELSPKMRKDYIAHAQSMEFQECR